jgi:pyruvate carboxylase
MPGGQYTNLREQARSMGLDAQWADIAEAYAQVNQLFGDIVKVTPTSKVVGDMALFMVANQLQPADVLDPDKEIAFPESVVALFKGDLGFPADGFPPVLQAKIVKGASVLTGRPGANLPSIDLEAQRATAQALVGHAISDTDLASYLMYPKVFQAFRQHQSQYGDVSSIPTPAYFYGLDDHEEVAVAIDPGKTLHVRIEGRTPADADGQCRVFFELNGQPRLVRVPLRVDTLGKAAAGKAARLQAEDGNGLHVGSPMPGCIARLAIKAGQRVAKGEVLATIEAMKMESMVCAERAGVIATVHVKQGDTVSAKTLLMEWMAESAG